METIETELFHYDKKEKYVIPVKSWADIEADIEEGNNTLIVKLEKDYVIIDLAGCGNSNLVAIRRKE